MQARTLSILAALTLPAAPALAGGHQEAPHFLGLGTETDAPRGYVEMCRTRAEWCATQRAAPQQVAAPVAPSNMVVLRGSAFPVILSFNFSIPVQLIAQPKAANAPGELAGASWFVSAASLGTAVLPLGRSAASATDGAIAAIGTRRAAQAGDDASDLLKKVNRRVNGSVVQRSDGEIFGRGEVWQRSGIGPGAVGDCEDIAIEKRLQLVAEGYPPEKLAFAVVYRRDVGLHTVLVARTGKGDMVLDSLDPYVESWTKAKYSWISVQSMEDPGRWFAPGARRAA